MRWESGSKWRKGEYGRRVRWENGSKMEEMRVLHEEALAERDRENAKLRNECNMLKKNFERLSERVEDLETNERKSDLVINGPNTPVFQVGEDLKSVGENLVKNSLKLNLPEGSVRRAVRIGAKPATSSSDRRSILLTLSSPELVQDVIRSAKTVKPEKIFVNENLTPTKHKIMQTLRKCKRLYGDKVSGCSSRFGRVSVWIKPPNPHAEDARNSRMSVNSNSELNEFCNKVLEVSLETVVSL